MKIDAETYQKLPEHLKALFQKAPNPSSDEVLAAFPQAPGQIAKAADGGNRRKSKNTYGVMNRGSNGAIPRADAGSAGRFFYCAKASREDRNEGCQHMAKKPLLWSSGTQNPVSFQAEGTDRSSQNFHPTVKPTELMRWLVRLVAPANGLVLDPFMGSGSTGKACVLEGRKFIGVDLNPEYIAIARARIEFAMRQGHQPSLLEAA